jgi:uncharacterized repeat protein (TIGR04076 family)
MVKLHKVKVTVHSITKGKCPKGHKVGDSWLIEDDLTPGGMCMGAFNAVAGTIRLFLFGGEHPWDKDKDVAYRSCPDLKHWVIYEIKRLRD